MKKLFTFMLITAAPMLAQALDSSDMNQQAAIVIRDRHQHEERREDVWGYFWNDDTVFLRPGTTSTAAAGSTFIVDLPGDAIPWSEDDSVHSRGIFVSHVDDTNIVIEHPGVYQVDYLLSGAVFYNELGYRVAAYLNGSDSPISGSVYATENPAFGVTGVTGTIELGGQFVFRSFEKFSELQIANQSLNAVTLNNEVLDDDNINVSASIFIKKIGELERRRHGSSH
jgi:hypothetical protein